MKVSGVYEVIGRRSYRGHEPGVVFEAVMDSRAEGRAAQRGDIRKLQNTTPSLQPGSYTLPPGWLTNNQGGAGTDG